MSLSFAVVTRATFIHKVTLLRNWSDFGKLKIHLLLRRKLWGMTKRFIILTVVMLHGCLCAGMLC